MQYRLTDLNGRIWEFSTEACALVYQRIYGGTLERMEHAAA
jgi:hypothetical protein